MLIPITRCEYTMNIHSKDTGMDFFFNTTRVCLQDKATWLDINHRPTYVNISSRPFKILSGCHYFVASAIWVITSLIYISKAERLQLIFTISLCSTNRTILCFPRQAQVIELDTFAQSWLQFSRTEKLCMRATYWIPWILHLLNFLMIRFLLQTNSLFAEAVVSCSMLNEAYPPLRHRRRE